jgi:YfiH family protein
VARLLFTSRNFSSLDSLVENQVENKLTNLIGKPVVFMKQSHSDLVSVVSVAAISPGADGLVTTNRGIALAVRVADCLPLLLISNESVAAVHVGRKGLLNQVALNAVKKMKELGSTQITGLVGPHICGACYEVDSQMYEDIVKDHPATGGKVNHLNLFAGLESQLAGIKLTNLSICTKENPEYFSYRAGDKTGRQVGVISL